MAKRGAHRREQVAETIRHVIAAALVRELRDPRVGRVTMTSIEVTADLSRARIRVVAAGEEAERDQALEGLESAAGFLRSRIAQALSTRVVPELVFELDRGAEHAARIDSILEAIRKGEAV